MNSAIIRLFLILISAQLRLNECWDSLLNGKKILVIGGSGRVGGSAVRAICTHPKLGRQCKVTVGGRDKRNWIDYISQSKSGQLLRGLVDFLPINICSQEEELDQVLQNFDVIIHTAGPFQGMDRATVLASAMKLGKLYLDVCDDIKLSRIVRQGKDNIYQNSAKRSGGTAIISTGIWPGCSSLLARRVLDGFIATTIATQTATDVVATSGNDAIEKVRFSFFTAGSGGAGPTILSATFLILGEDVLTYERGEPVYKKSATDSISVHFGKDIGERKVARLNLIECESCHEYLESRGMRNVSVETYFGTSPPFWNDLFVLMANIIPQRVLKDRGLMDLLARISLPMVRTVDAFVGSKNAIRVDVSDHTGRTVTGLLSHEDMEQAVGDAIAAFTYELVVAATQKTIPPGVYFPEEIENLTFRDNILTAIGSSAISFSVEEEGQEILPITSN